MFPSALLATLLPALAIAAQTRPSAADPDAAREIIALERDALERGARGEVDVFVDLSEPDVVYFDPFIERRIDGRDALREYYHKIFRPPQEEFAIELINPNVQLLGEAAVLTFNFRSTGRSTGRTERWNCTEVFRKTARGWRIIQTHWSWTLPQLAPAK